MDIRVIGGGALGCSAALALAQRGHDVTLLERDHLGAGATHKAAGVLSTLTWSEQEHRLIAATRGAIGETIALALCEGARSARDAFRPMESVLVGGPEQKGALDLVQRVCESQTEEPERLDAGALARTFPALHVASDEEGLVAQEDGIVDAGALVEVLRTRLEGEGVAVEQRREALLVEGAHEATVVAAGPWTRGLLRSAGHDVPLQNFRTQLAALEMPADVPILHDLRHGFYARPESEASLLAGDGTRLHDHDPEDYDERADAAFRDHIAQGVSQRLKDGGQARWRTAWAGLCVATPDRHPLCGAVPGADGLFVLSGDNGFGLMRCFALGEALADAVDGRAVPWLSPGRFEGRHLEGFAMREGFGDLEGPPPTL